MRILKWFVTGEINYWRLFALLLVVSMLTGCNSALTILDGATHARGTIHVEGYFTDTEGEVRLCKVPDDYTSEQAEAFCNAE